MKKKYCKNQMDFMLIKVLLILLTFMLCLLISRHIHHQVQPPINNDIDLIQKKAFIKKMVPLAQAEYQKYPIFPSVTIAQACLESDYGRSSLSKKYNNLFGMKGTDPNRTKLIETKEFVNNKWIVIKARFCVFNSMEECVKKHTLLLVNGTTWNPRQYQHVLNSTTYIQQAESLQKDGYATDPLYSKSLLKIIDEFKLYQYDYR